MIYKQNNIIKKLFNKFMFVVSCKNTSHFSHNITNNYNIARLLFKGRLINIDVVRVNVCVSMLWKEWMCAGVCFGEVNVCVSNALEGVNVCVNMLWRE